MFGGGGCSQIGDHPQEDLARSKLQVKYGSKISFKKKTFFSIFGYLFWTLYRILVIFLTFGRILTIENFQKVFDFNTFWFFLNFPFWIYIHSPKNKSLPGKSQIPPHPLFPTKLGDHSPKEIN